MVSVAFALGCLCAVVGISEAAFAPILNTRNLGQLVGVQEYSADGTPYYSFRGLRYGAPPVGPLRFKEPREAWPVHGNTIVNATVAAPLCPQIARHPATFRGSEDCLFLNVYTPSTSKEKWELYPVLVYIHGGAFTQSPPRSQNLDQVVSRGIVVVTVEYRVGVLGFLSSGDRDIPGNFGLLDQQLALKWVQQNIIDFSGDRNRVTLAGTSAGGASVNLHMLSPGSRGLFQRAIAASGVVLNPWVMHSGDPDRVRAVARHVGCPCSFETPIAALLPCLRSADLKQLAEASLQFQGWFENPFAPFGPVIDRNFISEDPFKLLKEGYGARVPLLISCTTVEGMYVVDEFMDNNTALAELDRNWLDIVPLLLDYERSTRTKRDRDFSSSTIRNHYFGRSLISNTTVVQLLQMETDRQFLAGIDRFAKTLASARGSLPVYMYQFAYRGESSGPHDPGHGADVGLIFTPPTPRSQADQNMARSLVDIWDSFIKTGSPTTANFPVWNPVPTTGDRLTLLNITSPNTGPMLMVSEIGSSSFWCRLPFLESGFTDC